MVECIHIIKFEILKSLSPSENELEMIYAVLKIDDKDSIDIVEFQAIARVKIQRRAKTLINRIGYLPEKKSGD